jgi:hypothetical protein
MAMRVGLLIALIRDFESLIETIGGSSQLSDVREFRHVLDMHEGSTVAQLAGKLAKGRERCQGNTVSAPIRDLQNIFAKLQTLLITANSKKAADDIGVLINILDGCDHPSVRHFAEQAKCWIANPSKTNARPPKEIKSEIRLGQGVRMELVRNYADALRHASEDNAAFDRAISSMTADKKVRAQEMREIAKAYLGYEIAKKKGRADAFKAIVDRQALNARQDARGRSLDRLKPW